MPKLIDYLVITPEYTYVEPVLDDGTGPSYSAADVIEIEAENPRDAKALGVKLMLQEPSPVPHVKFSWCKDQRDSGCSPYTGVYVEEI